MTDAISPEFRLEPEGPGSFILGEWQIDDGHALMLHQPTRTLFSIYLVPGTDPAAMSIYHLRARLIHVCDGFPVPTGLALLAASALTAFGFMTARLSFVELEGSDDEEIPF
jgi:hypothetical protein